MLDPALMTPLAMDSAISVLLAVTIVYVVRVHRRLIQLRQDREHLAEVVKGLQNATLQAEKAVTGLKLTAEEAGQELQTAVERGDQLKADLNFLCDKATAIADRLEAGIRAQRNLAPAAASNDAGVVNGPQRRKREMETAPAKPAEGRLASLLRRADSLPAGRVEPVLAATPAPVAVVPPSRTELELKRALEARR